jgi:3-hydroxyacyl-CoA dehydrogenase / enoyl-CoA hydratase / 3-hydroxybutyryl-CoA epimerase
MDELGNLQQFRAERSENNVLHLVFDMPGRPMNVFSNAAIAELAIFSRWLRDSDVKGVVIRSGKPSAFCAGADLGELGLAYDMIMAAPAETRDRVAFEHFFRLSQALRGIEIAGKPVAAAIGGLALGGAGNWRWRPIIGSWSTIPRSRLACRNRWLGCCREVAEPNGCRA